MTQGKQLLTALARSVDEALPAPDLVEATRETIADTRTGPLRRSGHHVRS